MRAFLHYEPRAKHQLDAMIALGAGLARHGVHIDISPGAEGADRADFIAWWGDKMPHELQRRPRLILEAGYINGRSGDYVADRLRFVSVGWNGLHGRADPGPLDCPPDRWEAVGMKLTPWRSDGNYILICDQHPGDSVSPGNSKWWVDAIEKVAPAARRSMIYRPHPLMARDLGPLSQSLRDAALCVTWSSTAALEAVCLGVPTVTMSRGSMAWDVTSHSLDEPPFLGDRGEWAYNLAYRQWTHEELKDGTAWPHIQPGLEVDL